MRSILLLAALAALVVPAARASPPDCPHVLEATGGSAGTTYYARWSGDSTLATVASGVWLYAESNGVWNAKPAGVYVDPQGDLQAGGSPPIIPITPSANQSCVDPPYVAPDTLIF